MFLLSPLSSYRAQLYQLVPCSDHGPMQTQQNSCTRHKLVSFPALDICRRRKRSTHPLALLARHVLSRSRDVSLSRRAARARSKRTLHPPFFSIVEWHFVHSLVFALIQLLVSESSAHFLSQRFAIGQQHGRWSASWQPKQNALPHLHQTVGMTVSSERAGTAQSTAYSQLGAGHHVRCESSST